MVRLRQVVLATLILAAAVAAAPAQEGGAERPAAREQGSFAGAFFVSTKVDPSNQNERSIEIVGSFIIWFLLALSVVSIGLIGHLALTNQRKSIVPDGVVEETRKLLKGGKFKEAIDMASRDQSYFSTVLHAALSEAGHGYGAMVRGLELSSDEQTTNRLRRAEYLNVLGQVSPMIGLFGTVYGMILAFQAIVIAGGNADPVLLAGGIGTALVTTFWGLIVAIPALAGYAIVRNKIDGLTSEATHIAEEIVNQFRPRSIRQRDVSGSEAAAIAGAPA
jgi:biopolymer transport protein ExbB